MLLESHHDGAEFRVALLGNHTLECLPLIQVDEGGATRAAQLPRALATRMVNWAREIFVLTGCRDYARVDFRLCPNGEPQFERIEVQRALARRGSFALAAECAGYSYAELMERIVWHAWSRHGVVPDRACLAELRRVPLAPELSFPKQKVECKLAHVAAAHALTKPVSTVRHHSEFRRCGIA